MQQTVFASILSDTLNGFKCHVLRSSALIGWYMVHSTLSYFEVSGSTVYSTLKP